MYMKQSKALLFVVLSMLSAHQAKADVRSVAVKGVNTAIAAGTTVAILISMMTALEKSGENIDRVLGAYAAFASLYATGYIIYKTYFEKEPVCPTCTPPQLTQGHN